MAAKVNKKFVVGMGVALVAVCGGVAATAFFLLRNNPTDLAKTGDRLMSEQKFEEAAEVYSKAVFKQQTNVAYLTKWAEAIGKSVPTSETKYGDAFNKLISAKRQIAMVQDDAVPAQREYLQMQLDMLLANPYTPQSWTVSLQDAQTILAKYATKPAGPWEVLKRFSGMIAARMYFETEAAKQEQLDGALADLEAALRADPADFETAAALVDIKTRLAEREYRKDKVAEGDALLDQGDAVVHAFLATAPNDPGMVILKIQRDLTRSLRGLATAGEKADADAVGKQFVERNLPVLDRAYELAKQLKQPVPSRLIAQLRSSEGIVDPSARLRRTEDLLRLGIAADSNTAELKIALAQLLVERGDAQGAMEQLEAVRKMSTPPVSMEGMNLFVQRQTALALQARWAVKVWQMAEPGPARDAALAKAQDLRAQLAAAEPDGARLAIVDAQLATIEGTPAAMQRAAQLLDRYNRESRNQDPEALLLTAQVAVRNNQLGLAEETLQKALALQGNNLGALLALAEIKSRLQNYEQAAEVYQTVLKIDKNNEQAKKGLDQVRALSGEAVSNDPVVAALVALDKLSEELTTDPDGTQKVIAAVKAARDKHDDPRMYIAVASAIMRTGDREAALAEVRSGLKKFPDNEALKTQEIAMSASSPLEAALAQAEATPGTPIDKAIIKSQIYRNAGQPDKANEMLEEARRLDPNDRRVMELTFVQMLAKRDFVKAKEMVDRAVRENLDGLQGDTYRARMLALENKHAEAVAVLQETVKRGGTQPEVYRMLGSELTSLGRNAEAAEALRSALKARPNDVDAATQLVSILALSGQMDEALATSRSYRKFGENDPSFLHAWLTVEAQQGDRDMALAMRERFARMMPDHRPNQIALATMLAERGDQAKARAVIDQLRSRGDGFDVAMLDADLSWKQGDRAKATETLKSFFAKQPNLKQGEGESMIARFLSDRGDVSTAITTLLPIRELQDKANMPIDRQLSDLYLRVGNAQEAIAASKRIVDAKADGADKFHEKRVAELLVRTGKIDEAMTILRGLEQSSPDATVMMLLADAYAGKGDNAALMQTLNDAVAKYPQSSIVFMRRAQVFMQDKDRQRDALADASKAVDLAPQSVQALRVRAGVYSLMNDVPSAVADIRAAIRLAPGDNDLLFSSIGELLRVDRDQDAQDLASEALAKRPRDVGLMSSLASLFSSAKRFDAGRRYMRQAFDVDTNSLTAAQAYLDMQLNNPAPEIAECQRVLSAMGKQVETNPGLVMASAKVRLAQGRAADAARIAQDALKLLDGKNSGQMGAWYTDLSRMMPDKAQLRGVLESASRSGINTDWMTFFRGVTIIEAGGPTRTEGVALLDQAARTTTSNELKALALRTKGLTLYQMDQHAQAVEAWKASMAISGDTPDLLNNAAFVLAKNLGKPEEALPMAEKAATMAPSAEVLDTLGVVYLLLKRPADAVTPLERSLRTATQASTAISAGLHLAEAHIGVGKPDLAKEVVTTVQRLVDNTKEQVTAEQRTQLQDLRTTLGMP